MNIMTDGGGLEIDLSPYECDVCGENKLAIVISNFELDGGCFDITNAICLDCIDRYRQLVPIS